MFADEKIYIPAVEELKKTGLFKTMNNSVDEDEHSIEMHLPYTYKIFER
jgi:predicted class III extradiol MEMO1 family dioxygenase